MCDISAWEQSTFSNLQLLKNEMTNTMEKYDVRYITDR